MPVVFPLLALLLLPLSLRALLPGSEQDTALRSSVLAGGVIWGVLTAATTEVLGVVGALHTDWLAAAWGLVCIGLVAVLLLRRFGWGGRKSMGHPQVHGRPLLSGLTSEWRVGAVPLLVATAGVVVALVAAVALIGAPNDTDSMKYHLMRAVHWMQNGSVGMFPSEYLPQLYQPPWAEYAQLNLMSMSGGDRLAALVQWLSFVGTGVAASLIARRLGAGKLGQTLAAVAALALPGAILQASTAQNADVVTFWVACAVYYFLTVRQAVAVWPSGGTSAAPRGRRFPGVHTPLDWPTVALLGASAGLAVLTKGTGYVYLLPLAVWYLAWSCRRLGAAMWKPTTVMAVIILALIAPYLARNIDLFGQPFGPEGALYTNAAFGVRPLLSNLVRNLALQLGTPSASANHGLETAIDRFHELMSVSVNDHRTTWINHVFHVNPLSLRESTAGNPLQLLLALGCIVTAVCSRLRRERLLVAYCAMVLAGFVLFCFYLKWQPWNSRLHLPFLALCCPVIGLVLERMLPRWGVALVGLALLVISLPWVLNAQARPLFGARSILTTSRTHQYFASLPAVEPSYRAAAGLVGARRCREVGFVWGSVAYQFEYPLWVLLKQSVGSGLRVQDIGVDNASRRLENRPPFADFRPCAIVGVGLSSAPVNVHFHGGEYRPAGHFGVTTVFVQAKVPSNRVDTIAFTGVRSPLRSWRARSSAAGRPKEARRRTSPPGNRCRCPRFARILRRSRGSGRSEADWSA